MKKLTAMALVLALFLCLMPGPVHGAFSDVPSGHWALGYIEEAEKLGVMQGMGEGRFGLSQNVKRGEFAAMLVRLFGWDKVSPALGSFTDNRDSAKWYYSDIETAVSNGAVIADQTAFRPEDRITRSEMAVMLVRALGYDTLAAEAEANGLLSGFTFKDVKQSRGYIALASDFGIITGRSAEVFDPSGYALREEAAAMMVRLYSRYTAKTDWKNAYYAIASYSQMALIAGFDNVTFGWSRMGFDAQDGIYLNTTSTKGNEFAVPDGYEIPVDFARREGKTTSLNVFMSAEETVTLNDGRKTDPCSAVLLEAAGREEAAALILAELTRVYPQTGTALYDGVTLDFECMRGETLKAAFVDFLKELKPELDRMNKTLAVAVHPVWRNGLPYYDGYDYKAIGELADRVILMAHDYAAKTMDASMQSAGFTVTPVTPFPDVYYALKAITDPVTGVADRSKIALAISIDSAGWTVQNGAVTNKNALSPVPGGIGALLSDPNTVLSYSERYRNPSISYMQDNDRTVVWYEDARSIGDKIALARMFGVTGVSVWRLGLLSRETSLGGRDVFMDTYAALTK